MDAILSVPHLHSVKSCLQKSKFGDWIQSAMIATEYSYKLGKPIVHGARPAIATEDSHILSYFGYIRQKYTMKIIGLR